MDMSQSTRKWSELHGIAVVSIADGKKIGTCDDFYFDPSTQSVYALQVKTGLLGHEVRSSLARLQPNRVSPCSAAQGCGEKHDRVRQSCHSIHQMRMTRELGFRG